MSDSQDEKSATELEQKRAIFTRSVGFVIRQLDHDARKMEESAIVDEIPLEVRHQRMDLARGLRQTIVWLTNLIQPEQVKPAPQAN